MGLLRVKGTIDLAQFWPAGDSDADTTPYWLRHKEVTVNMIRRAGDDDNISIVTQIETVD